MDKSQAVSRINKLREQINEYRYNYHVLDKSIMSEAAADSLKHELTQLEAEFPDLITPDSPTQRVAGKPLEKFKSVRHQTPMLSLQDVFSAEELEAWTNRAEKLLAHPASEYFVEIKKDGLAGSLIYQDGSLVQGLTRGDGQSGEDVTANFRTIETVPLTLRRDPSVPESVYRGRFEVRGEVLLYKKDFDEFNAKRAKEGKALFANPRNTAAGAIRQLDTKLVAERKLRFMVYLVMSDVLGVDTLADEQELAKKLGFLVEPHGKIVESPKAVMDFADEWSEKRKTLPFGTDGLVITINDHAKFRKLGVVGKAPRGAVAYKFAAEQATTKLKDIQISIGRTGAATPFAVLEPTVVAGSTIQMATLHNAGEIDRKDIRIGDTVIIQKAGDIIPEVVSPLPKLRTGKEKKFVMPTHCPICGTKLEKTAKEAIWRCPNPNCYALERGRIIHFAGKEAFDIEGLGEKTVDQLLQSKLIADPSDLFSLTEDDVAGMDRFADLSASNLVSSIQSRKQVDLDRFIYSLGIRHVGRQTATDLAAHFGSLDKLAKTSDEELKNIEGIGEVVAQSIAGWLKDDKAQKLLEKLAKAGVKPANFKLRTGKLVGRNFVVTGSLESMSRGEAEQRIVDLGGKFQSAVTAETDYLVVGANTGESKLAKAKKIGTKQVNEAEFLRLIA